MIVKDREYTPNSHKYKAEQRAAQASGEKKVEKVVKGTVKTKKNKTRKIADIFLPEDVGSVKSYLLMDVLVPTIKRAISDTVDMFLYGESGRNKKRGNGVSYVSYRDYSNKDSKNERSTRARAGYSYDDVVLDTRADAEQVLDHMRDIIETYDSVSVADMYDLVGETCEYTDHKYGWTNLRNAEPVRVRDGYILKLPKVIPL